MRRPSGTNRAVVLIVVLLLASVVGCGKQEGPAQHHQIRGLVMALDSARNHVVIAHEEIPHYMKAMTMSFTVKESNMLRGIEVGDSVRGVVTVKKSEIWLDSLVVVARISSSEPHH
jgi:Cu/Ag efflux protein CusF